MATEKRSGTQVARDGEQWAGTRVPSIPATSLMPLVVRLSATASSATAAVRVLTASICTEERTPETAAKRHQQKAAEHRLQLTQAGSKDWVSKHFSGWH